MTNKLFYGDNLDVLRTSVADESVDLVYLDPPFNSNASYNVLFKAPSGAQSQAQIEAFDDTWHWNEAAERAFDEVLTGRRSEAAMMLRAMRSALGENDMMAYLAMMAARLIELHRVLKPTGSLYLHCDPTASHYLKILLDSIFEARQFLSEVIWKRTSSHSSAQRWGPVHDTIFCYSKTSDYKWNSVFTTYGHSYVEKFYSHSDEKGNFAIDNLTFAGRRGGDSGKPWRGVNPDGKGRHWAVPLNLLHRLGLGGKVEHLSTQEKLDFLDANGLIYWPPKGGVPRLKRYLDFQKGVAIQDVIADIDPISSQAQERLGYPTQKPLALLERIISASSNENDLVLDPFCGCGTAVHAAQKLNRQWIGVDITHLAIALIERRLKAAFPGIAYEVHGVPKDADAARDLAARDKHEFQKWIVATIEGQPYRGGKKGMDRGIDGYLHFRDADNKPQLAIISVKGGGIKSGDIRDLKGAMEREGAALGLFLTLKEPTREMEREAASAGLYETGGRKFSRLQILTAEQVIEGKRPAVPFGFTESLKKAFREADDRQGKLL